MGFVTANVRDRHCFLVQGNSSGKGISVREMLVDLSNPFHMDVMDSYIIYCFPGTEKVKRARIHIIGVPEREKREYGENQFFKEIKVKNLPKLTKDTHT